MNSFSETQRFRQWWLWLLMIVVTTLVSWSATMRPNRWPGLLAVILVNVLLLGWRLDTRYDLTGIHYRVRPFMKWRTIRWSDVTQAVVASYEFVGYGIRWNAGEWVYNVAGNQGLQIRTTTGKRLVLGTQRPDKLRAFLATMPERTQ